LILVCFPILLAGCGRESSAPPPDAPPATAPASPRGPLPASTPPAAATTIPESGDTAATLRQLTQALRDYVVRTRTVPKDFEELAAKAQVTFPPPPAGQKYSIKGQEVVLVKR
jgi:hypothetical protein